MSVTCHAPPTACDTPTAQLAITGPAHIPVIRLCHSSVHAHTQYGQIILEDTPTYHLSLMGGTAYNPPVNQDALTISPAHSALITCQAPPLPRPV